MALRQINRLGDSEFGNLEIGQELILPATPRELQMERPAAVTIRPTDYGTQWRQPGRHRSRAWALFGRVDGCQLHCQSRCNLRRPTSSASENAAGDKHDRLKRQ